MLALVKSVGLTPTHREFTCTYKLYNHKSCNVHFQYKISSL